MSRLCISGSRHFPDTDKDDVILAAQYVMSLWLETTKEMVDLILVGDCPTGVDKIVMDYYYRHPTAREMRVFQADWDEHGNRAGPIRNQEMIDLADLLLAFPLAKSRGTEDTIRRAKAKKIPVYIYQNGHVHLEES